MKVSKWMAILVAMSWSIGVYAGEEGQGEVNNGQDPTRPLSRFDFRYQFQNLADGLENHIYTLRLDKPFRINQSWQIATRFDIPLISNDVPSRDNPNGDFEFGAGDLLSQVLLVNTIDQRWAWGFGTQVILPTGSEDQMGKGLYRLIPTAAVRYSLPEISKGSFFVPVIRYDYDVADQREDAEHVSVLQMAPTLNINLRDSWFVTLFPSTDIQYNCMSGDWFVPFNMAVGKMLNRNTVASMEFATPLIDDYPLYEFKIEFRIGFFF